MKPLKHPPSAKVRDLAESLIGTCDMEPEKLDELSIQELSEFDAIAFRCVGCGWWCSQDECNEDLGDDQWYCDNCADDLREQP